MGSVFHAARRRPGSLALILLLLVPLLASRATEPGVLVARPGPALRAALEARDAGDPTRAEALLALVAVRHPVIADYANLLRLQVLIENGRAQDALVDARVATFEDSPLLADFYEWVGRAHAEQGDEPGARARWDAALSTTDDDARLARLRLALARSFERSGAQERAVAAYLDIWTDHPESQEDAAASERLDALERELGRSRRNGAAQRKRGDSLYAQRANHAALEAYDGALASGELGPKATRHTRRQRAQTLFRLRRYTEATEAFAMLPRDAEARIQHARSVARAGDVPAAVRELERLGRRGRDRHAARANLLAALLLEDEGEEEARRAHALYALVVQMSPRTSYATAALWRLGWSAYRQGRYEEALPYLERLEQRESDPIAALRARYWRTRAAERAGREGTKQAFAELAREFPLSYYGWRARSRASGNGAPGPVEVEVETGSPALAAPELARPRILLEAGLEEYARTELDRLMDRAEGLEDRLTLAQLYSDAGDFHRSQRLVISAYGETLARGPAPVPIELWWHAWPKPYDDELRGATADGERVDPALVYAVMREESGYRPAVVSVSGARGLLQLMPETAEKLAREEALAAFTPDDLFKPRVNIQLGSAYLAQLQQRFPEQPSAAIGSYNAGPHVVVRWLDDGLLEDDEWVEAIPYEQTRTYVKRVLRSLHAYRVLY